MYDIISQSFGVNIRIMRALRFYPDKNFKLIHRIQAFSMYFICIILVPSLTILNFLIEEDLDILQLNYVATFLAETLCWISKLLPLLINPHKIKRCIHFFGDPRFENFITNEEQKKIIKECVTSCKRNSLAFLIGVIGGLTSFITKPLFWNGYRFPIDMWLPFDAKATSRIYYGMYMFLSITISYAGLAGTAFVDPLIGGLAYHAACQLKILKNNLQHLDEHNNRSLSIHEKIKQCIIHHNAILTFTKDFEECFSLVVFSQFAGSLVAVCFCCLQLSMMDIFSVTALSSVIYIFIILGQIYFYCHYGTKLFQENNTLSNGLHMGNWYNYDEKSKKALIILMEKSKRPIIITAGKILPLSLETFTMTLKRTYSLVAVLKNYQ